MDIDMDFNPQDSPFLYTTEKFGQGFEILRFSISMILVVVLCVMGTVLFIVPDKYKNKTFGNVFPTGTENMYNVYYMVNGNTYQGKWKSEKQYESGSHVSVSYSPCKPADFAVNHENSQKTGLVSILFAIGLFLLSILCFNLIMGNKWFASISGVNDLYNIFFKI
jgi:hypothetical protein